MCYSEIIKEIMIENNFSQADLAKKLGVNQTTVSQWILGRKKPGFDSIYLIYQNFNITPNQLFGID